MTRLVAEMQMVPKLQIGEDFDLLLELTPKGQLSAGVKASDDGSTAMILVDHRDVPDQYKHLSVGETVHARIRITDQIGGYGNPRIGHAGLYAVVVQ
jgi:hypothetical protein